MAKKQNSDTSLLQNGAIRLSRVHFWFIGAYAIILMLSDAWNLITRDLVWERWAVTGAMLIVTTLVWYLARANLRSHAYYRALIIALVLMDVGLATFAVYTERGMASRGVALYALAIVTSTGLLNRTAMFGAAALSTACYVLAATRYFYVYFNEGYKIELYSTLMLYSVSFFVLAALLWVVMTPDRR
jgi:hypothetical protein